jgi:2-amino-4-hydroxy-6-hydroxymethyldihydropteridine diphosphokinase
MNRIFLGLGSNLGDRMGYLSAARESIEDAGIRIIAQSSILETDPVEYTAQPVFLNQVILVETALAPHALLDTIKGIEIALGRTGTFAKGPRVIDIDILIYGDLVMADERLVIPHPGILTRSFVRDGILEIDPSRTDPATGISYMEKNHG